jgi:hypothetical protein
MLFKAPELAMAPGAENEPPVTFDVQYPVVDPPVTCPANCTVEFTQNGP